MKFGYFLAFLLSFAIFTVFYFGNQLDIDISVARKADRMPNNLPKTFDEIRIQRSNRFAAGKRLFRAKVSASRSATSTTHFPPKNIQIPANEDNFTVVTALFDIGRGKWYYYRRPYEYYLSFMTNLLNLDVNLVIFADEKSGYFAEEYRRARGLKTKTHMQLMTLETLELFGFKEKGKQILEKEQKHWDPKWDAGMKTHPESTSFEYNLLVNSKPFFMQMAARENHFKTDYFYWFDAGFGHNKQGLYPADNRWVPRQLMQPPANQKITVIQLFPEEYSLKDFDISALYRKEVSVISGGFFGGKKDTVVQFYRLYTELFRELINTGYLDDDQTVLVLLINRYPQLFNIVHGEWFDALKMFQ